MTASSLPIEHVDANHIEQQLEYGGYECPVGLLLAIPEPIWARVTEPTTGGEYRDLCLTYMLLLLEEYDDFHAQD